MLMVEDEETVNQVFCRLFQLWKWDTRKALTCASALAYLQSQERFDLVILDIMLPDCSGVSVLRWVREQNYPARIIVSTAHPDMAEEIVGLQPDLFLPKPCIFDHIQRQADLIAGEFFAALVQSQPRPDPPQ